MGCPSGSVCLLHMHAGPDWQGAWLTVHPALWVSGPCCSLCSLFEPISQVGGQVGFPTASVLMLWWTHYLHSLSLWSSQQQWS